MKEGRNNTYLTYVLPYLPLRSLFFELPPVHFVIFAWVPWVALSLDGR